VEVVEVEEASCVLPAEEEELEEEEAAEELAEYEKKEYT
jgi:hypothetical protein